MVIFNITSAEIKTKSAAVLLKMTTILKELRIAQLCFKNERREIGTGKCFNETHLYNALALLLTCSYFLQRV